MKLLEKNNRIFFRFTALLLLVGTVVFYLAINWIIRSELDEKLEVDRQRTENLLRKGESLPQFAPLLEVEVLHEKTQPEKTWSNTMVFDPVEGEDELYRQLVSTLELDGNTYRITNRTSLVESEDLLLAIGGCTLGLALLLFAGLYWLNRRTSRRLWAPFQQQLEALRNFSLSQNEPLTLASSGINEFEELKTALQQLTEKVRTDYRTLKEFTENASHEIQTPLAIIRSKIEYLVENEPLTDGQLEQIGAIYEAANRLSRLNQSLLLLAKIENRQFGGTEPVPVSEVIREQVGMLAELTNAKNLVVKMDFLESPVVTANRSLVEILIKNLLENAIRYSQPGDTILVKSEPGSITFANPGTAPLEQPERLFQRFQKRGGNGSSLGLGLAIVKEICGVYDWGAGYDFREGRHEFGVRFLSQNL